MRLFITGVGGFVGAAVAQAALRAGHAVAGTVRDRGRSARLAAIGPDLEVFELDLRDRDAVVAALAAARPDALVHAAWGGVGSQTRFDYAQVADNVDASCHLLLAAAAAGLRKFVGIGSQGEYGPLSAPVSEAHLPAPTSLYGAAKLAVLHLTRQLAQQNGIDFAWLRLFASYGPGDNPNWLIPSLIHQLLDGTRPRTTGGAQLWDYLYIDDVAAAILTCATRADATGVFNLGSGVAVPVRDVVERIRDRAAPGLDLVFGEVPYGPTQIWHMQAEIGRLTSATGWRPAVDLDTGLDRTVAWVRAHRPVPADA